MRKSTYAWLVFLGVAVYLWWSYQSGGVVAGAVNDVIGYVSGSFPPDWLSDGAAYVPYINQIEQRYGLPQNYLAAVAFQESSFNPGAVNASSGAAGMFQLLPQYYPGAGQSWQTDAATAARALSAYFQEFGDWQLALAAYNWGPGNVSNWISAGSTGALPSETSNYVGRIAQATGVTGELYQA